MQVIIGLWRLHVQFGVRRLPLDGPVIRVRSAFRLVSRATKFFLCRQIILPVFVERYLETRAGKFVEKKVGSRENINFQSLSWRSIFPYPFIPHMHIDRYFKVISFD
jgi:hypothetical protein